MKTSKLIRNAAKCLEAHDTGLAVWEALHTYANTFPRNSKNYAKLCRVKNRINTSIWPAWYVVTWLERQDGVKKTDLTMTNLFEYNKLWLKYIASGYEAHGD